MTTTSVTDTTTIDTSVIEIEPASEAEARAGALAERLFTAALGGIDLYTVYLGVRLGLYAALVEHGPCNAAELAAGAGIDARYAREWVEQQTVAGILACDDRSAPEPERRFSLPSGYETVLLDPDSPVSSAPLALALVGIAGVMPQLLAAYRSGTGVPYAAYGPDFRDGQAGFNRPSFSNLLTSHWLQKGLPEVHDRLTRGDQVRIADIACGAGWSSIAFAQAYPHAHIDGYDIDDASIADARRNAAAAGVADRIHFEVADAGELAPGSYDLVCIFEALHDMSRPVDALRAVRAMAAEGGSVIVMDERTADSFAHSEGPIEAFMYGASVLHCLPVGMSEQPSAATGTMLRTGTMRDYAVAAGFADVEVLPIEHDLFRFYRCL